MTADRPATDFGSKLREARERRGVSVRDIANATKISAAALDALERNDISKLPGGIFSRAFVRSYAVEVGLDPETTIQEFIAAFPNDSVTVGQPTADVEDFDATESQRRIARTVVRLLAVSVPIIALVLYFGTAGRRGAVPPDAVPAAATAVLPPPLPDTPSAPVAAPQPAPASPESAAPPPPAPVERPTAAVGSLATPELPAGTADLLTIGLSVRTPCVVSAIVDGRKAIDQVLRPGDKRTIEVRREIVLTVGDAAAVAMTLNGSDARPLGKAGEVVTARMNPANYRTYLPPR